MAIGDACSRLMSRLRNFEREIDFPGNLGWVGPLRINMICG
jgi:hypothetical protein